MPNDRVAVWMTDVRGAWLDDATRWITEHADALGLGPQADVQSIKERPWGAVLRVETAGRELFFKAEGPGAGHEPVVLADIASTHPKLVPDVLAIDVDRGWLLMGDAGTPMWDLVEPAGEIEIWSQLFGLYADMQRSSTTRLDRWIAAGAPDRRVHLLPRLIADLLASDAVPLDDEQRRAFDAARPHLERVCAELAASLFAQAIDHSDMHGGNVLISSDGPRLADWGDACITHPFASMFVTYQHCVAKLPATDRQAATLRLRDAYLEPWSDDVSSNELRDVFEKAMWLAQLVRALNFAHQLGQPSEWGESVAKFLTRWQEQSVLLGRGDDLILAVASQTE